MVPDPSGGTESFDCSADESAGVLSNVLANELNSWYKSQQHKRNVERGKPYFNGPSPVPDPRRHSPSQLLKCHRRVYYQLHNAPAEKGEPTGIFWFGSRFETEVAVPFLQSLTRDGEYIRNSMWVDFTVDSTDQSIRIRGETDSVFVDADSEPLLLTEIKTTTSLSNLEAPKPQHLAQVHAYLYGLSEQFERRLSDAVILYAKRDDFSTRVFHVQFEQEFWEDRVLTWASQNSEYRRSQSLPPPTPEFEWECDYCPYRRRCGRAGSQFSDEDVTGLLPFTDDYPRAQLENYLEAYPDAKLTPTLALRYPELAEEWGTYDWQCPACSSSYSFESVDWDGDLEQLPYCKPCAESGLLATLEEPKPDVQPATRREE
ncbi:CRISPR-associated protein Cas4 [Haloarchaeobius amylolyticus]|uniref:CRISPR-associated protein Cas4 n=1 Tax=Haloarchaeobius amylolyticus TaxID=1198296 RepID=UPI002271ED68|nr:PD-(D/E)XK nuclease family protein [Haloarchaeobius amylolyticus]